MQQEIRVRRGDRLILEGMGLELVCEDVVLSSPDRCFLVMRDDDVVICTTVLPGVAGIR